MKTEEALAESLKEIGIMITTMIGAMKEMDASLKVRTRGAGISRFNIDGIAAAASNLEKNFISRLD